MTTLKDLKSYGALAADKPIKRDIKFNVDGEEYEATIFVHELSVGAYEAMMTAQDNKSRTAKTISEFIRLGEDGKERISYEEAYKLKPGLSTAIIEAFNEVNSQKKASRPATDSSAS